jgi:hypothetical protein
MARRQRHAVDFRRIPGGDDQAARVRIAANFRKHVGELIDGGAVRRRPGAPLPAVDRTEIAVLVGPFVPDGDAMLVEIFDVGVAAQEPEQFVDDGFDVQLLGGDQREAGSEIEAHLMAEHRARANTRAVALFHALGEHAFHKVEILAHERSSDSSVQLTSNERPTESVQDRCGMFQMA